MPSLPGVLAGRGCRQAYLAGRVAWWPPQVKGGGKARGRNIVS
jgi:hypothetical protein